jgi:hypothetical protein
MNCPLLTSDKAWFYAAKPIYKFISTINRGDLLTVLYKFNDGSDPTRNFLKVSLKPGDVIVIIKAEPGFFSKEFYITFIHENTVSKARLYDHEVQLFEKL